MAGGLRVVDTLAADAAHAAVAFAHARVLMAKCQLHDDGQLGGVPFADESRRQGRADRQERGSPLPATGMAGPRALRRGEATRAHAPSRDGKARPCSWLAR